LNDGWYFATYDEEIPVERKNSLEIILKEINEKHCPKCVPPQNKK
jgi:hypothetical protein